jgi:hypothetical protein
MRRLITAACLSDFTKRSLSSNNITTFWMRASKRSRLGITKQLGLEIQNHHHTQRDELHAIHERALAGAISHSRGVHHDIHQHGTREACTVHARQRAQTRGRNTINTTHARQGPHPHRTSTNHAALHTSSHTHHHNTSRRSTSSTSDIT